MMYWLNSGRVKRPLGGGVCTGPQNARENALQKLRAKNCDWIVLNNPSAIGSLNNEVELIDDSGHPIRKWSGSKQQIANQLIEWLESNLPSGETK
ncbi:MAG: hypothetical protein R3C11_21875 [Planctomycetaceae bacterium]